MRKKIDIRMCGYETELVEMLKFLGAIQYLGNTGSSRDLKLSVDGDGSGNVNFEVLWGGETEYKELQSTKLPTDTDQMEFEFYLGE